MARKTTKTTKSPPRKTRKVQKEISAPRQGRPVFRAGTWITLLLLAVLIGVTYYLNNREEVVDAEATPVSEAAFVFEEDSLVSSIEVKPAGGETVKVERDEAGVWALTLPFEIEADQSLAEAAASQIASLQIVSEVDADPKILGLASPAYVITIEFEDGKKSVLEIGDITPTNSGYYVRLDGKRILIISLSGIDPLINLALFPPYLNTPTPTALPPTETPVPATESISTPEAGATPTP